MSTPLASFSFSQLSSQTVIYLLPWRGFIDVINVPNKLVLEKYTILDEPDLIRWA